MVKYLEKMWDGYHKALEFRQEQLPSMEYDNEVVVFQDGTFEDHIIDFDAIMIFFHGSGCSKCDAFMAEYMDTAKDLLMYEPHISMGKMDCSSSGIHTCNKYRVPRLPWFKLFKQGQDDQDYVQARRKQSITKFMRNFFGSAAKKLRTVAEVEDYLHEEEGSVLAFLDKDDKEVKSVYDEVAKELRGIGFYFGYVTNPKLRTQYPQYDNKIVHIRANILDSAYEEKITIFEDRLNGTSLQRWLIKEQQGLMGFRDKVNDYLFQFPLVVIYIPIIIDPEYAPQATINTLAIRESFMSVAKNYSKQLNFALSDKKYYKYELRNCGYSHDRIESHEPLVCMFREEDRFNMKMVFNNEAFSDTLDKFIAGRSQRFLRSEKIPDNSNKSVLDVVSTTFADLAMKSARDVFILFYKPECVHCQDFMQTWMDLGEALKDEEVDVVRINMMTNEIPPEYKRQLFVKDYPSMFFKVLY